MPLSQSLFLALLAALAGQRLAEVGVSRRHEAALRARGGRETGSGHYPLMVALHGGWLVGSALEVVLLDRPFVGWLAAAAGMLAVVGQLLRLAARRALGRRWTTRVITVPGDPPVTSGIFRHLRHPNYVGVVLELAAVPLIHTAWLTATAATIANGLLLTVRVRAEERALEEAGEYRRALGTRPRFLPRPPLGRE